MTIIYEVEVDVFDHHFHILLNAHYPIMAFASTVDVESFAVLSPFYYAF